MQRRRLVLRVYAFAVGLSIAVTAALVILPRYTRGARYLEPQAALLQYLVERWSLKDGEKFAQIMGRIEPRLRGTLSLYDLHGNLVRTNIEPALDGPTDAERATLRTEKWALSTGRIVVRSDDGTMIGVYAPNRPGFPWSYVLPMGALLLVLVGAASVWFSRRLARPLDQLATAARRFGAGDTTARARQCLRGRGLPAHQLRHRGRNADQGIGASRTILRRVVITEVGQRTAHLCNRWSR
jgi:HAMP domain-containing protein